MQKKQPKSSLQWIYRDRTAKRLGLRWGIGFVTFLALLLNLNACTRSTIPLDITPTVSTGSIPEPVEGSAQPAESILVTSGEYAVAWIPEGETLKLRDPAGISGTVVDELEFDTHGIHVTGNSSSLGSSLWVEIVGPGEEMGWANSWNLTEHVIGDDFCADVRIVNALEQITQAFLAEDIQGLLPLTNPERGLILRHDWWNPEVIIQPADVPNLFVAREDREWGTLSGGDFAIEGSFREVFNPLLQDILSQIPTAVCRDIPEGVTSRPAVWPREYVNLHYYAFHRPSPEGGNRFDWRTLAFGFEYIQGEPYLTLLVHYHGDI